LTGVQAAALLAVSSSTWDRMRRPDADIRLNQDQLTRVSAMVGILKGLRLLFADDLADRWPSLPNRGALFEGLSPINAMIEDREKFEALNKELQTSLDKANSYKDVLINKLRKHNLAKLSLKKPRLVEKKINDGTKKLFRSLERISGAVAPPPVVPATSAPPTK